MLQLWVVTVLENDLPVLKTWDAIICFNFRAQTFLVNYESLIKYDMIIDSVYCRDLLSGNEISKNTYIKKTLYGIEEWERRKNGKATEKKTREKKEKHKGSKDRSREKGKEKAKAKKETKNKNGGEGGKAKKEKNPQNKKDPEKLKSKFEKIDKNDAVHVFRW
ncbi:hypothetical protein L1887_20797 [Cichorium endivia]|nr:hypothetical protein L1887_20797 [Cichorium endivia]